MIHAGLLALTGASGLAAAWQQFAGPGDVVGIKVNPNGLEQLVSSPAAIMEIVQGLISAGVEAQNILIYERYAPLMATLAPWFPSWLKTAYATPTDYTDDQTGMIGYDAEHFVDLPGVLNTWQSASNPQHTRSFAAQFITRRVTKLINLAVLKEHNAAGVTLCMKNLSHGLSNNVNRSHPGGAYHFTTYIPAVVSMNVIRYKVVLNIIDGIHGLYEWGPRGDPKYLFAHKTMYFSTDAVAIDRIGWNVIDAARQANGLPVTAKSTAFMKPGPFCQPQYINSAAQLGLGEDRLDRIDLRKTVLS